MPVSTGDMSPADTNSVQVTSEQVKSGSEHKTVSSHDTELQYLPKLLCKYQLRHLTKNRVTVPPRRLPSTFKKSQEPVTTAVHTGTQ